VVPILARRDADRIAGGHALVYAGVTADASGLHRSGLHVAWSDARDAFVADGTLHIGAIAVDLNASGGRVLRELILEQARRISAVSD
jgi:hypothetical protein